MGTEEMRAIGRWIARALEHRNDPAYLARVRADVHALTGAFPLYGWLRAPAAIAR
jgi:glycine/serine hydroxymethyltransferase